MTTIGQDPSNVAQGEVLLESEGAKVLTDAINADMAWTRLPVISTLVNMIVEKIVDIFIGQIDKLAFAVFTAAKTGREVSDYINAQASGDENSIDNSGDALIHLGS